MSGKKLNPEALHFARVKFKLLVHESNGQAYEDLFVKVMTRRYPTFKPIKPHGTIGDRKNDGYRPDAGSYYQVFAPQDASQKVVTAVDKAEKDFVGLKAFWEKISPIKEYRFVFNDKFHGPYPDVEKTLAAIKKANNLVVCECMLAQHLYDEFTHLDEQSIMDIVGLLPGPGSLNDLDFPVFASVIRHVMENPVSLNPSALLRVPDFNEKIQFNNLSNFVGALLTRASFQAGAVLAFFQKNSAVSKMDVRNRLADLYVKHRDATRATGVDGIQRGDTIFFALLKEIIPSETAAAQDAAIVLMAHFFESCDIYEDPNLLT